MLLCVLVVSLSVLLSDDVVYRCSDFHVNGALQIFYDDDDVECIAESCVAGDVTETLQQQPAVNDADDNHTPPHHHYNHRHNGDNNADNANADSVGDDVTVTDINDVILAADGSASPAETSSNGASTLSSAAGDTNSASTTSAGDCVNSDGSFNGFIVAMHRKMVLCHLSCSFDLLSCRLVIH